MPGFAEENICGYLFVGRICCETVCAREIDDCRFDSIPQLDPALFLFNSDTGIIPDLLPHAGEGIEERRLSGVRISDDCDGVQLRWSGLHKVSLPSERRSSLPQVFAMKAGSL